VSGIRTHGRRVKVVQKDRQKRIQYKGGRVPECTGFVFGDVVGLGGHNSRPGVDLASPVTA
jgi:hypothetical protein